MVFSLGLFLEQNVLISKRQRFCKHSFGIIFIIYHSSGKCAIAVSFCLRYVYGFLFSFVLFVSIHMHGLHIRCGEHANVLFQRRRYNCCVRNMNTNFPICVFFIIYESDSRRRRVFLSFCIFISSLAHTNTHIFGESKCINTCIHHNAIEKESKDKPKVNREMKRRENDNYNISIENEYLPSGFFSLSSFSL